MSCRLDYLFKLFPQWLSLADCRQHFVTIIRKGQRWQEFNGQIRVIEWCRVWQYFLNPKQKTVFISDQQHSELFFLNYLIFCSWKCIRNSKGIPESFFSSSQVPFKPFLLKETWLLTIPSWTPWNIWKNTSNISLHPPLFPYYVSHHVNAREVARRRSVLPLASRGLRFPTKTPTHLYKIIHTFLICNNIAAVFDMKREESVEGTGTVKRTPFF